MTSLTSLTHQTNQPILINLTKHKRYGDAYLPGDMYWGLGIENETYIELQGGSTHCAEFVKNNQKRERYSVDYWKIYKNGAIPSAMNTWIDTLPLKGNTVIKLPLLLNGHTLTRTDRHGEPMTTYTKYPQPNPKYSGTSLFDDLCRVHPDVFRDGQDVWWTLDGDTVEFMTQNYYCAKMEDIIEELLLHKKRWITAFQSGLESLPDREHVLKRFPVFPSVNHGLAVYLTNRKNVGIFNNGTYHINITLPTLLDKDARIANMKLFEAQHRNAARLFQWITPFLIAKFGSGDVFARLAGSGNRAFPAGSQRLCASRYASAGIYDTDKMETGKVLTKPYEHIDGRWYERIYENAACAYSVLPELGVDINYNKHWNHGLEFRIFDWFPESELSNIFRFLIWMCDESLRYETIEDPRHNREWNTFMSRCVWEGASVRLTECEAAVFSRILDVSHLNVVGVQAYMDIWNGWRKRWNTSIGSCTYHMIRHPIKESENVCEVHIDEDYVPFSPPLPAPAPPAPPAPPAAATAAATATAAAVVAPNRNCFCWWRR